LQVWVCWNLFSRRGSRLKTPTLRNLYIKSCEFFFQKNIKLQDFMNKKSFFFGTISCNPWAMLVTWLHVRALQKYKKIEFTTRFKHWIISNSYGVGVGLVWCYQKACERCSSSMKVEFWTLLPIGPSNSKWPLLDFKEF
jgi:hypothetical protein